jgi:hypothetical protein
LENETVTAFLSAITAVESPLKFWAFIAVVFLALAIGFFRSTALHRIWAKVVGQDLNKSHRFRIIRLVVGGLLAIALVALILAFAAPLLLKRMDIEQEAVQLNAQLASYAVMLDGKEGESIQRDFASAMAAFKAGDYVTARRRMVSLQRQVASQQSRETLQGLITATYYARKEHTDGLEYICEQYKDKPNWDARFRYQIHAHVRRIAINEGYEDAEKVVLSMRTRCRRSDFSPIWAGIGLDAIERIVQNEELPHVDGADKTYLHYAIEHYPNDAMLDHALLALGQEEELLRRFPDSMLSHLATGIIANRRSNSADYAGAVEFGERYLAKLPNGSATRDYSSLTASVIDSVGSAYLALDRLEDARKLGEKWRNPAAEGIAGYVYSFAYSQTAKVAVAADLAGALDKSAAAGYPAAKLGDLLPEFPPGTIPLIKNGTFAEALGEINLSQAILADRKIATPEKWTILRKNIATFAERADNMSADDLFTAGLALRDQSNRDDADWDWKPIMRAFSMGFWKRCIYRDPQSSGAMKAAYLRGTAFRREGNFREAVTEFSSLVARHAQGELADDALAELVSYNVQVIDNVGEATKFAEKLSSDYAMSNAVDNALYLIGNYYRDRREYLKAANYYSSVAVTYSGRRLALAANDMATAINEVVSSAKTRVGVPGLHFYAEADDDAAETNSTVADIDAGSNAAIAGLVSGDHITHIAGKEVETVAQFYQALAQAAAGQVMEVTVKRGFDEKVVVLRALLAEENYYSKALVVQQ